ncbi:MAG: hypothetical protein KME08_02365 [Aphanothece sp. CMT-3BRIN-NPC111]|nr:hypothetical protein [Aphanothece sp. CMT-3BRIN-NPC111]
MRLQMKLLAGTTLSVLLSTLSLYPAMAQSGQTTQGQSTMEMNNSQTIRGTVREVFGNVVRVDVPNSGFQDILLSQYNMERLNLRPGAEIIVTMNRYGGVSTVALANGDTTSTSTAMMNGTGQTSNSTTMMNGTGQTSTSITTNNVNTTTNQTIRGRITSITGDVVTLSLVGGGTRDVTLNRAEIGSLNLQPGSDIVVMMANDGSMRVALASDVQQTTSSTTTRYELTREQETVIQPTQTGVVQEQTSTSTRTTTTPAVRNAPVRALW